MWGAPLPGVAPDSRGPASLAPQPGKQAGVDLSRWLAWLALCILPQSLLCRKML